MRRVAVLALGWAVVSTPGCGSRTGLETGALGSAPSPSCAPGMVVLYSGPPPLSPGVGPAAIAVDTTSVYWTAAPETPLGGSVMKVPLCGGAATTLATATSRSGIIEPGALAVDATNVYWAVHDEASGSPGDQVMQVPIGGGASTALASEQHPRYLAVDPTSLYWADSATVVKVPLGGGAPIPLGEGEPQGVSTVVVDATGVYFWAPNHGLQRLPLDGGRVVTLVQDDAYPDETVSNLAISGGNLYWGFADNESRRLLSLPVGGGTPATLVTISPPGGLGSTAVDGVNVYWLGAQCTGANCVGAVMKVPVGGGTPVTVASGWQGSAVGSIAVDATSVYWTAGNSVMKMTPK